MNKLRHYFFLIGINLILLGAFIYLFSNGIFYFLKKYTYHSKWVYMPNLSSLHLQQAIEKLEALKLGYTIDRSFYDPYSEEDQILNYAPLKGECIKEGRKVYLQVNAGGFEKVKLPLLLGKEKTLAVNSLLMANLLLRKLIYLPDKENDGKVIGMLYQGELIKEGTSLPYQSKVSLMVGRENKREMIVPDLRTMSFDLAKDILEKYDFIIGNFNYDELLDKDKLRVYRQIPEPGSLYYKGQKINLWFSDFKGEDLEALVDFYEKEDRKKEESTMKLEIPLDSDLIIE